jgi:hypothetical protein
VAEKFGVDMREAEIVVAEQQGVVAVASRELANTHEKACKLPATSASATATAPVAALVGAVCSGDVPGGALAEQLRAAETLQRQLSAQLQLHLDSLAAAVAAGAAEGLAGGGQGALGGLQPSAEQIEKERLEKLAVQLSGGDGARTPEREARGRSAPYG